MSESKSWQVVLEMEARKVWDDSSGALLLSKVPGILKQNGFDLDSILRGDRLRFVIERDAANLVRVVNNDADTLVWGIVPADVKLSGSTSELFSRRSVANTGVRYSPVTWKAFASPIEADRRRFLIGSSPDLLFVDQPKDAPPVEGGVEIERDFLARSKASFDPQEIAGRIEKWIQAHDEDREKYLLSPQRPRNNKSNASGDDSILGTLLTLLDGSDLKRITIPLDIIHKLFHSKVKERQ
jgi:hypothetical protein